MDLAQLALIFSDTLGAQSQAVPPPHIQQLEKFYSIALKEVEVRMLQSILTTLSQQLGAELSSGGEHEHQTNPALGKTACR